MQLRAIIRHRAFVVTALVAWVFATRLWLIAAGGSIVPFMDQWGAEAIGLYRPWFDGVLAWRDLFAAHNEHRIVLTRLGASHRPPR